MDTIDPNDAIITSIEEKMKSLHRLTPECCIYRVPHRLRRLSEEFYKPKVVSIGPLHHGDKGLEKMEEKKMIYLNDFLQRNNVNLWQCFETVREGLERLRSCYAEDLRYKENELELVKIIVVDAVFVVEALLKCSVIELRGDNDRMFNEWILRAVGTELLLLENQLPFFILDDICRLGTKGYVSLKHCCYDFFTQYSFLKENEKCLEKLKEEPKHLLDLLRTFYEPASSTAQGQDGQQHCSCAAQTVLCIPNAKAEDEPVLCIPNATRLHEAGVELKMTKTNELLDIVFTKGTMEIPVLEISDDTESILRNLIAFEQCHNCEKTYLSDYTRVMDSIINTPKDVDLLVEKGIVVNLLGHSDDVCKIINRLQDGVIFRTNFHYARLYKEVDLHCKTPWHQWKATLKHDYFNTPWAIISFIAAVVLIVLTIIQTACSIISTINGK